MSTTILNFKKVEVVAASREEAVAQADTNKADAKNAIKELYKTGAYKGNAELVKSKDVVEGQAVVATAEYTPSKNTNNGTWIAFGIEA